MIPEIVTSKAIPHSVIGNTKEKNRVRFFEAGLRQPWVSAKFELRYVSLKSKFSLILFAYNLMIGYSKKNRDDYPGKCFDKKIKKPGLNFNPGLALTGVRTTGPRHWTIPILNSKANKKNRATTKFSLDTIQVVM